MTALIAAARAGLQLLGRLPGIAWVGLLVAVLLAGGAYGILQHGEQRGAARVERRVAAAAIAPAIAQVQAATQKTDVVVAAARRATTVSDSGRTRREQLLVDAASALQSAPPTITALVAADNTQIRTDSITAAVQGAAIAAFLAERAMRDSLEAARVRQAALEPDPPSGGHSRSVAIALGTAAVVLTLWHLMR